MLSEVTAQALHIYSNNNLANAARAPLGSDLENALARARAFATVDGGSPRSVARTIFAISLVGLVYLAIPWRYVYVHYIKAGAERWR
jgi:hypothetical protein